MAIYFAGAGLDSVEIDPLNATVQEISNNNGFTTASIRVNSNGRALGYFVDETDGTRKGFSGTVWFHALHQQFASNYAAGTSSLVLYNSAGTAIIRLQMVTASTNWTLQYWNGSSWVDVGVAIAWTANYAVDIKIRIHASQGEIEWFYNNLSVARVTGIDTSGFTNVASFALGGTGSNGYHQWTEMLAASFNTLGHRFRTRTATGNSGTNTAWDGDYTAIDEVPVNDADNISSATATQVETFTAANLSATPAGSFIKGVAINARIRRDDTGPQNAKAALRIGSTNYLAPYNFEQPGLGFNGRHWVWSLNPATAAAWSAISEANCEFGLQSVA